MAILNEEAMKNLKEYVEGNNYPRRIGNYYHRFENGDDVIIDGHYDPAVEILKQCGFKWKELPKTGRICFMAYDKPKSTRDNDYRRKDRGLEKLEEYIFAAIRHPQIEQYCTEIDGKKYYYNHVTLYGLVNDYGKIKFIGSTDVDGKDLARVQILKACGFKFSKNHMGSWWVD